MDKHFRQHGALLYNSTVRSDIAVQNSKSARLTICIFTGPYDVLIIYVRFLIQTENAAQALADKGCEITYPDVSGFAEKMDSVYSQFPQFTDMRNAAAMTACTSHYAVLHTQEVTGSSPAVSTKKFLISQEIRNFFRIWPEK